MSVGFALVRASAGGSIQLLSLCAGGAALARKGILDKAACSSWSRAIFNLFLPSLLFNSILQTVYNARQQLEKPFWDSVQLLIPGVWAIVILLTSSIVAELVLSRFTRLTEEPVKRVLFISLLLGNANNLPILLINNLCKEFGPLREEQDCSARGTGYVAVFLAVWNSFMWTIVLSYLLNASDTPMPSEGEALLEHTFSATTELAEGDHSATEIELHANANQDVRLQQPNEKSCGTIFRQRAGKLFSPPFMAILVAAIMANAIDLLGSVVVPGSSLIVGARLYAYRFSQSTAQPTAPSQQGPSQVQTGFTLTPFEIAMIVGARFVLLPLFGRTLFHLSGARDYVQDPLLQLYLLIPFCMPTASNSVVMAQMATLSLPNSGSRMENALLTIIFWQYIVAPFFLTANMALNLLLVFGNGSDS